MIRFILSLLSLVMLSGCAASGGSGETSMTDSAARFPGESLQIRSFTVDSDIFWYNIHTGAYLNRPTTLQAWLIMPDPSIHPGPVAAMVILHDSGHIQDDHEFAWARFLADRGIAALVVDSFGPRGVANTISNQLLVTEHSMVVDAYRALEALSGRDDIDPMRIGLMGFSKGATATYYAAWQWYAERLSAPGTGFAAFAAFYPGCSNREVRPAVTGAPILIVTGADDDITPPGRCADVVEDLEAQGVAARQIVYPGARHSFDNPQAAPPGSNTTAWNAADCVWFTDFNQPDIGFKTARAGPWQPWDSFDAYWNSCFTRGFSWGYDGTTRDASRRDLSAFLESVLGR